MGIQVSSPLEHGIAETQENEHRKGFLFVHTTKPLTHFLALL